MVKIPFAMIGIIWVISPAFLIPLFFIYLNKYNKERKKNHDLNKQIESLLNPNSSVNPNDSGVPQDFNNPQAPHYQQTQTGYPQQQQGASPQQAFNNTREQPQVVNGNNEKPPVMPMNNGQQFLYPKYNDEQKVERKSNKISSINVILIVGVIFIILSGVIFSTTTWQIMPDFFKTIIIFSVTTLFFCISVFTEKKLKLERTSTAFYFLDSIFLPICMIMIGFFKLFGNWFTLSGDGKFLLFFISSVLLGIASFIGTKKYSSKLFAFTFYSCITLSIIFLLKSLYLSDNVFALCLAIVSAVIIFVVSFITNKETEKQGILLSNINKFVGFNTIVLGSISVFISGSTYISAISMFIFAFAFLSKFFNSEKQSSGSGAFLFISLIGIGLYKLIIPEDNSDIMILLTATAITSAIVGMMLKNEKVNKLLRIFSVIAVAIGYIFIGMPLSVLTNWTGTTLITGTIMLANLTFLSIKYKDKKVFSIQPFFLILLVQGFITYLNVTTFWTCILVSAFSLLAFIVYKKVKLLRTYFSDILFAFTPFVCMFVAFFSVGNSLTNHLKLSNILENYGFYMVICSVIFTLIVSLIIFEKDKTRDVLVKLFEVVLPFSISTIVFSIYSMVEKNEQMFFFIYFAIIIVATILSIIYEKRKEIAKRFTVCLEIYSYILISISFFIATNNFSTDYVFPYFWATALFLGIKAYVSHKSEKVHSRNAFFYTSSVFALIALVVSTANITSKQSLYILVPTIFTLFVTGLYVLYKKTSNKEMLLSPQFENFFAIATAIESVALIVALNLENLHIIYFLTCLISIVVSYYMFLSKRNNIFAFIPTLMIYPFINVAFNQLSTDATTDMTILSVIMFALIAFSARIIHKKVITINKGEEVIIDWLTILNILVIFNIQSVKYSTFINIIIMSIYLLLFLNRFNKNTANPHILTASCLFAVFAFWAQPFFEDADIIMAEINSIPVILFCIAFSFIWKGKRKFVETDCFFILAINITVLLLNAMLNKMLVNALILAGAMLVMLIISYMKKRKKWFILSIAVLVFLTIYLSRRFWVSLEWWIYLLITGTILIAIASINEVQKQKGSSFKTKASRLMSDWEW
ncbi:MAG TPA: DUF2157 domain-containing protein [Clostridiales bacterium]|nr:DUF2157 domain-containing protein [Clostridiales bacterium]